MLKMAWNGELEKVWSGQDNISQVIAISFRWKHKTKREQKRATVIYIKIAEIYFAMFLFVPWVHVDGVQSLRQASVLSWARAHTKSTQNKFILFFLSSSIWNSDSKEMWYILTSFVGSWVLVFRKYKREDYEKKVHLFWPFCIHSHFKQNSAFFSWRPRLVWPRCLLVTIFITLFEWHKKATLICCLV